MEAMGKKLKLENAASAMGRKGGPARAKALSPERRSEIARKAVMARWAKQKQKKGGK